MENKKSGHNHRRTSSEIICEARGSLNVGNGLRVMKDSRRPITPHTTNNRHLFGRPSSSLNSTLSRSHIYFLPEVEQQCKFFSDGDFQANLNKTTVKNDSTKLPLLTNITTQNTSCNDKLIAARTLYEQKSNKKKIAPIEKVKNEKIKKFAKLVHDFEATKEMSESTKAAFLESFNELKATTLKPYEEIELLNYLFVMSESDSPEILTNIAEIMLLLAHNGKNVSGACKIIYKLSKNNANDKILVESDLPELFLEKGIARINPIEEVESIVYGYGALRFLMFIKDVNELQSNKTIGNRLLSKGIVQVLTIHLQLFNDLAITKKLCDQHFHALFQLSESLREAFNFIVLPSTPDHIKLDDSVSLAAPQLLSTLQFCTNDLEMQLQILRTLSVMSETQYGNRQLANKVTELGRCLKPLSSNIRETKKGFVFMCRVGYIIGNIVEEYDYARILFYEDTGIMGFLIENLEFYANGNVATRSEVLIKLIRIVANLSINPYVGSNLGNSSLGVILLHMLLRVKESKTTESEELLEAILGTIHNIVYYLYNQPDYEISTSDDPGSFYQRINDIASVLFDIIQGGYSKYSRLESANILGNISRLSNVNVITERKLRILIGCLNCDTGKISDESEFLTAVIGILVNILADWETRLKFKDLNGITALRKIFLRALDAKDWKLATLCCQAFWNIVTDCKTITEEISDEEGQLIANHIAENLDEKALFKGDPPEDWEPFAVVASDLLERFQLLLAVN
ncbi:armadillo repeat-containing protein 2 [Culicoides brevitarsis]|uniref:armadillo repeat-containing protein 2 n=1 Tax=Culicoides brevitarsis TaxID=469753 RepID=UPI00307BE9F5